MKQTVSFGPKPPTPRLTRRERVGQMIERGDVAELLYQVSHDCGCMGPKEGEPECPCIMTSKQIRAAVSLAALRRGELVRLKKA